MSILDCAKEDYKQILGDQDAYSVPLTFQTPDKSVSASIIGHGMSHHLKFETDGQAVNSKNSHVTFSEADLVATGYVVRNSKGNVSLTRHLVSFSDSNGVVKTYKIVEPYPDETLGIILCILGEYNGS